mgnify:CR=1 FL=1
MQKPRFKEIKFSDKFSPIVNDSNDLDIIDDVKGSLMKMKTNSYDNNPFNELSVDDNLIIERNNEIKKIEQDLLDINEIMMSLNTLVAEQGEIIDIAEKNIENTVENTTEAVEHLKKAEEIEISTRRTTVATVTGATIGGVALGGVGIAASGVITGAITGGIGTLTGAITGYFSQ